MSHEVRAAAALVIEHDGEQYRAFFRDVPGVSGFGHAPAVAERALLDAYRAAWWERVRAHEAAEAELESTRADMETLRQGVTWLGAELDRAKRWGALWKRAAKRGAREWRDLAAAYEDMRAENTTVRRVARLLVAAWRQERQATQYWAGVVDLYRVALERATAPKTDDAAE